MSEQNKNQWVTDYQLLKNGWIMKMGVNPRPPIGVKLMCVPVKPPPRKEFEELERYKWKCLYCESINDITKWKCNNCGGSRSSNFAEAEAQQP